MNDPFKILYQSFVKSFYKENAGAFAFLFTMLFFIVGKVDGAGLFEYHYSLIIGMLKNNDFLLLVFFTWFLYARKYTAFVHQVLHNPQYAFLHIFNCLDKAIQFKLFLIVEIWLLMPVLLYAFIIIFIGYHQHFYLAVLFVIGYLLLLCFVPAAWHVYLLNNPNKNQTIPWQKLRGWPKRSSSYPGILIRFVANKQKMMWVGIKVFTCGSLYMIARNNTLTDFDTGAAFLFYIFGILGNGVIVYRLREFEETYLAFYRGVSLPLMKRFLQYSWVYFILLIPEFTTISMLVPAHLYYADAIRFSLGGYSLLLLMNTITFLQDFSMKEYLKILLVLFCVQYIFLMTAGITFLYLFFFTFAIALFLAGYYEFERNVYK